MMPLKERAAVAFDSALERAGTSGELDALRTALTEARRHLEEPMRVAIVGHIKAGKSTVLNALLGEELAPTGAEELTFNVNWLRHGSRSSLRVHFKDGREPEERTLAELDALTSRREEHRELLSAIRYIDMRHPNEVLRTFDLVDTPGLKSFFAGDSENTLRFLGLSVEDVESVTRQESAQADALLCLFARSLASSDQSVVAEFQGPLLGNATPINAIGVLTKADVYWDPQEPGRDPLEEGRKVVRGIEAEPDAERVFFAVLPVAGLLAFGARTLTTGDLEALDALSRLAPERLAKHLRYAQRFATDENLPVPSAQRASLIGRRLGQYGIWLAAALMRDGVTDPAALGEELWRRSGVGDLRDLVVSHFGHRATLIKTQTGVRTALDAAFRSRAGVAGRFATAAGGALEEFTGGEPAFEEFALLRRYYQDRGSLGLVDGEGEELLRVTGEHGTTISARLGLDRCAPPDELVRAAQERLFYWEARRDAFGAHTQTIATARVLTGAYQRIFYHAREARRHLELEG
jgi:hypothetical protein